MPRPPRSSSWQRRSRTALAHLFLLLLTASGCADRGTEGGVCSAGDHRCVGSTALICSNDGAGWQVEADCAAQGQVCTSRGCRVCEPDALQCRGVDLSRCNSDGSGFIEPPVKSCDATKGEICDAGECTNACTLATINRSYVGCEYWAVDLDNAVVEIGSAAAQQFAVALSNPSALPATVRVRVNDAPPGEPPALRTVTERTVEPQQLELLLLPAREVDGSPAGQFDAGGGTALTANAYKIESSAPIIAYQFNPLSNVGVFSNDASLLVPTPALSSDSSAQVGAGYLVMGWPQTIATTDDLLTNFGDDLRAFLTIVGTREQTQVRITLSTDIVGDQAGQVPAAKAGETLTFTLEPFDVLNLETGGFGADFTGTQIQAAKPVAVFSGSEASDVPNFADLTLRKCCADHLEQQLFPITTLGTTFIALTTPSRTEAVKAAGAVISAKPEREVFRILAAGEFTQVGTSLPPPHDQLTIDAGNIAQLQVEQDFTIQSNEPVVVGQFVAGQDQTGIARSLPGGDPSFILLPPVEQFRTDYLFLTPDKYAFDFVMVAAPRSANVTLDGRPLREGCLAEGGRRAWCCSRSEVGAVRLPAATADTPFVAFKCQLSFPQVLPGLDPPDNLEPGQQNDGVHRLTADQKVGLVVYGFDAYVSYGYPGGTDLALINLQ